MDVNVDMGESFGRYTLGDDEAIMQAGATSINVATCFHAGDPTVLVQTVKWAKQYGVAVGAHPGLPDMQGFGRRRMDISREELYADMLYQIGALDGVCRVFGVPLQHVKPHGVLYRMVSEEEYYMDTFLEAIASYNPDLFIVLPKSTPGFERGVRKGLRMAAEALIDLGFTDEGIGVIERVKVERSPEEVAARAVKVAIEGKIDTISGKVIDIEAATVCCHGDAPNAAAEVTAVVRALKAAGVPVGNLGGQSAASSRQGVVGVETTIVAHMPGMVARVVVAEGDRVVAGQEVAVLSVMKTELSVESQVSGVVSQVIVQEWDEMEVGSPMLVVQAD